MKYGAAFGTTLNWGHATVAQPGCGGRHIRCTRGRGVGGCSLVNGMLYNRGAREIYDAWGSGSGSGSGAPSLQAKLEEFFGEILIPTEKVVEVRSGVRRESSRRFFPGYMLVQMELTDHSWHLVNDTPKITGFVGNATQPKPVPDHEVSRLTKQIDEGTLKAKPRVKFTEGEDVRVVDGPFANFNGVVETVNEDKGKVRVMVSIFGRSTPVELEFVQVEKA